MGENMMTAAEEPCMALTSMRGCVGMISHPKTSWASLLTVLATSGSWALLEVLLK